MLVALPLFLPAPRAEWLIFLPGLIASDRLRPQRWRPPPPPLLMGLLLVALRLPAPPAPGEPIALEGTWDETLRASGRAFEGRLAGRPGLRIRGTGGETPRPGSRLRAMGLLLPGGEFRALSWRADDRESRARLASSRAGPDRRERLSMRRCRHFPSASRPLARALLMGDRRGLPARLRGAFRDAGLAHLLALSGLHVGLFLLMLRRLLGLTALGPFRAEWALLLLLPLLPWLWGSSASVRRALLMAGYVLLWRRCGGRARPREALAAAALTEFLIEPAALLTLSFRLSYLATLALIGLRGEAPPQALRARIALRLRQGLQASLGCTAAGLPVLLGVFERLPPLGPLWNLPAGLLCAPALGLGWLAVAWADLPGAAALAALADTPLRALGGLAELAGHDLAWVLRAPAPPVWVWLPWSLGYRRLVDGRRDRLAALLLVLPVPVWLLAGSA